MKNMYLLRSEVENVGDCIFDLNATFTVKCKYDGEHYIITLDYTHSDAAGAVFETEQSARAELEKILQQMGVPDYKEMAEIIKFKPYTPRTPESFFESLKQAIQAKTAEDEKPQQTH